MNHPAEAEIDQIIAEYIACADRLAPLGLQREPRISDEESDSLLAPGDEAVSGRYPVGLRGGVR